MCIEFLLSDPNFHRIPYLLIRISIEFLFDWSEFSSNSSLNDPYIQWTFCLIQLLIEFLFDWSEYSTKSFWVIRIFNEFLFDKSEFYRIPLWLVRIFNNFLFVSSDYTFSFLTDPYCHWNPFWLIQHFNEFLFDRSKISMSSFMIDPNFHRIPFWYPYFQWIPFLSPILAQDTSLPRGTSIQGNSVHMSTIQK